MKLKTIILISVLLITQSCSSQTNEDSAMKEIFERITKNLLDTSFDRAMIDSFGYDDNYFLNQEQVKIIYQNDTLINEFDFENDYCYLFGKNVLDKRSIVVLRSYGEWMKTLELLTYDPSYNIEGSIVLCGAGGGMNYQNQYKGYFENDSIYVRINIFIEDEGDPFLVDEDQLEIGGDTTYSKFLFAVDGSIFLIE